MTGSRILGLVRITVYLALTLVLIPLQALAVACRWPLRRSLPRWYHGLSSRIIGLELEVHGTCSTERPTLFVSNHSSYLDIEVLGALIPGSFVAKTEVGRWPFFGLLAKLQETVFVDRQARREVGRQRDDMKSRLLSGDHLILFPEGTSSDGNRLLPLKTALFAVASLKIGDRPLVVQPVSVTATALEGVPLGRTFRHLYAWYGDMDLAPHLWNLLTLGHVTVAVEFHPPVTAAQFGSRKALADHCSRVIAAGIDRAVSGCARPPTVMADSGPAMVAPADVLEMTPNAATGSGMVAPAPMPPG